MLRTWEQGRNFALRRNWRLWNKETSARRRKTNNRCVCVCVCAWGEVTAKQEQREYVLLGKHRQSRGHETEIGNVNLQESADLLGVFS